MSRFVEVPADAIRARLSAAGFNRSVVSSHGSEEVWIRSHDHDSRYVIKVYTSLTVGAAEVRDRGADAIRVVALEALPNHWPTRFVPIFKAARVYRTAPQSLTAAQKADHVCDRMIERCREAYAAINAARVTRRAKYLEVTARVNTSKLQPSTSSRTR